MPCVFETLRGNTPNRNLAYTFSAVVLVTNQVTSTFSSSSLHSYPGGIASIMNSSSKPRGGPYDAEVLGEQEAPYIIPALGNTWHHCVSNRASSTREVLLFFSRCTRCTKLLQVYMPQMVITGIYMNVPFALATLRRLDWGERFFNM